MKFLENKRFISHCGSSKTHDMVLYTGGTQPVRSPLKMVRTAFISISNIAAGRASVSYFSHSFLPCYFDCWPGAC